MRSEGVLVLKVIGTLALGVCGSLLATRIDRAPADKVIIAVVVGVGVWVVLALQFYYHLPRRLWSLLELDAVVISALVFRGDDEVLLVRDHERKPPWVVPPSAHLGVFTSLRGGPHLAVVRVVKAEAGIDIEMPKYPTGAAATRIADPIFAQSEKQWSGEGHDTHHDYYFVGTLAANSPGITPEAKKTYEWFPVDDLHCLKDDVIPHEMIKVIKDARDSLKQPKV